MKRKATNHFKDIQSYAGSDVDKCDILFTHYRPKKLLQATMRIGMSFRVSSKNDLHSHCEVDYPDIPMTMAGLAAPSLMMHQLPSSARSSASSSCSCLRIGKRRSRRIFINGRAADTICSYAALKKTRMIQSLAEMIFEKDIYDSAVMCAGIRLPLVAHVPKLQPRQRHKSAIANCHGA